MNPDNRNTNVFFPFSFLENSNIYALFALCGGISGLLIIFILSLWLAVQRTKNKSKKKSKDLKPNTPKQGSIQLSTSICRNTMHFISTPSSPEFLMFWFYKIHWLVLTFAPLVCFFLFRRPYYNGGGSWRTLQLPSARAGARRQLGVHQHARLGNETHSVRSVDYFLKALLMLNWCIPEIKRRTQETGGFLGILFTHERTSSM